MAGITFSPDVLAANPDLASKLRRTKTPSGKGNGHTDDAQDYAAVGQYVHPSPRQQLATLTQQYIEHLKYYAPLCGIDEERLASLLGALASVSVEGTEG